MVEKSNALELGHKLLVAVSNDNHQSVSTLLEQGAPANFLMPQFTTTSKPSPNLLSGNLYYFKPNLQAAMHIAASNRSFNIVEVLLRYGGFADIPEHSNLIQEVWNNPPSVENGPAVKKFLTPLEKLFQHDEFKNRIINKDSSWYKIAAILMGAGASLECFKKLLLINFESIEFFFYEMFIRKDINLLTETFKRLNSLAEIPDQTINLNIKNINLNIKDLCSYLQARKSSLTKEQFENIKATAEKFKNNLFAENLAELSEDLHQMTFEEFVKDIAFISQVSDVMPRCLVKCSQKEIDTIAKLELNQLICNLQYSRHLLADPRLNREIQLDNSFQAVNYTKEELQKREEICSLNNLEHFICPDNINKAKFEVLISSDTEEALRQLALHPEFVKGVVA